MKPGWLSASLISLITLSVASPATWGTFRLGVWLTYWDLDRGVARLATPAGREVRDVFLFSAALDTRGRVILLEDPAATASLVSDLEARGSRVWLTIVNDVHPEGSEARPVLKDARQIHRILSDPRLALEHRREIVDLARKLGVSGVDIDYENLDPRDRDLFTSFAASLASGLGREQIQLSVTAQPKERESLSVGPGAHDWRALCDHVDRLQIKGLGGLRQFEERRCGRELRFCERCASSIGWETSPAIRAGTPTTAGSRRRPPSSPPVTP